MNHPSEHIDRYEKARLLAKMLESRSTNRVVFAESCTCGLVAALLGSVPGISEYLCGSTVTYRESAKQQWLGVKQDTLAQFTAESMETTVEMATGVLGKTSEANFAAAITGNLGPDVDSDLDGLIFVVVARRNSDGESVIEVLSKQSFNLKTETRLDRQQEAADLVLVEMASAMQQR